MKVFTQDLSYDDRNSSVSLAGAASTDHACDIQHHHLESFKHTINHVTLHSLYVHAAYM